VIHLETSPPASLLPPAAPAERLSKATWRNGRLALGLLLVLAAVLGGALFLQEGQQLLPVYAAARDLPSGTLLTPADLAVVRVRLPGPELRHYLQPTNDRAARGRFLTMPVAKHALVPAAAVAASIQDAGMVELPIKAEAGDVAQGLRPGDRVQVLAAYTDGARRGEAVVLLPTVEVTRVLHEAGALTGSDQQSGVQVRMPADRAPLVTAAIATARVFVVKAPSTPVPAPPAATLPPPGVVPLPPTSSW